MSKTSVSPPGLPIRMMRRIAHSWSRIRAVKRHEGTGAAIRMVVARSIHAITIPTARLMRRVDDLVGLLPLPFLFGRQNVLFVGYLEAALGLGESLRGLVRSVAATGLGFALYPFNTGVETRLIGGFMEDRYDMKRRYKINVIEMAADQVPTMFRELGRWKTRHSYNILRTYWELPKAPAEWASMLEGIHEIWAPNEFVANAFREIFDGPIIRVPPCVDIEAKNTFDRAQLGMDPSTFYFLFSFDYFSQPARKNPLAVVRAFQTAFPNSADRVGLVIKATNATEQHLEIRLAILKAARHDRRIKVIDHLVSRDEMLSLMRQSNCYVSLHRSEGFGLGMAESMAFGKPVIGTDFSGNTEFLSDRTGFPVSFAIRPVQPGEYIFSESQSWAEPDNAAATEAMRRVFRDPHERQRRATAGKAFVDAHYGRDTVGRIAAQRLQDILTVRHGVQSRLRAIITQSTTIPHRT
jgi:glycosyltransferase involved in cell wall biosynthesis